MMNSWNQMYDFMNDDDSFADSGLEYDEFEVFDPDERMDAMEKAGLNPYDFGY